MKLEQLLASAPPEEWRVGQLHALGWYDGPEEGVCALAVPGGEFYFEKLDERYNPDGLDERLFRLSELPAGSVAEVVALVPDLASGDEAIRQQANLLLEAIRAKKRRTPLVVLTPDWEHFLGFWSVPPAAEDGKSDWFSLLGIPRVESHEV
jgi:hypothetical protein